MEERAHGKEEACFWWLLDQFQGLQGQHGVRYGGVAPSEMTKKIWGYVKKKKLANKK